MSIPLVIFHAYKHSSCDDGFAAALCAYRAFAGDVELCPRYHGQLDPLPDVRNRDVFILDFSFSMAALEAMAKQALRVVWLDHHAPSFEKMSVSQSDGVNCTIFGNTHVILDNFKSGALLAWEYFNPDEFAPDMILHIDDSDRMIGRLANTRKFILNLRSQEASMSAWSDILDETSKSEREYARFVANGEPIAAFFDCKLRRLLKETGYACSIEGFDSGRASNCTTTFTSEIGNLLARESGSYGLVWYLDSDGVINASLRSVGDYSVRPIARAFGGDGHDHQAAFRMSPERFFSIVRRL